MMDDLPAGTVSTILTKLGQWAVEYGPQIWHYFMDDDDATPEATARQAVSSNLTASRRVITAKNRNSYNYDPSSYSLHSVSLDYVACFIMPEECLARKPQG